MAWTWRYENDTGGVLDVPPAESFPTKADAESWLGESWRELAEAGVAQVVLLEDGRVEYGPMSLSPAD